MDLRMTRLARRPAGRKNRIAAIGTATALLAVLAGASSAQAAPSTGGGSSYLGPPAISDVICRKGCVNESQAAQTAGKVRVRRAGSIKIRGRNLGAVHKVLFTGNPKRAGDEFVVKPSSVSAASVSVPVREGVSSGQVKLIDEAGRKSKASKVEIQVLPRAIGGDPNGAGFIWPVEGPITGVFGENRGDHYHSGLDIAAPSGTKIKAAASGKVTYVGSAGGYGNFTCVSHGTLSTCYAHQSRFAPGIEVGSPVEQGGVIGYVGNTGNSSGAHLHFEVRQGTDERAKPLNPLEYLPERSKAEVSSSARARAAALPEDTVMDYNLPVHSFEDAH